MNDYRAETVRILKASLALLEGGTYSGHKVKLAAQCMTFLEGMATEMEAMLAAQPREPEVK